MIFFMIMMNFFFLWEESIKLLFCVGVILMMNGFIWWLVFDLDSEWYCMCLCEWMVLFEKLIVFVVFILCEIIGFVLFWLLRKVFRCMFNMWVILISGVNEGKLILFLICFICLMVNFECLVSFFIEIFLFLWSDLIFFFMILFVFIMLNVFFW